MRYKQGQKVQTYQKILAAAERSFKKQGYNGIGVDGLAKEAGVTSGAFYGHFKSKMSVFSAAIVAGLNELREVIEQLQEQHKQQWWQEFAKIYMGQKRLCDLSQSCALQSLTAEVSRSNAEIRAVFQQELLKIITVASNKNKLETKKVWSNLSMLIGAVTLARAVKDEEVSNEIATAILSTLE
ncbi:MAG TPA: TetR/AcrR family transcriptional regulator [Oceanospirillales bacterium]|nr:TetR/AcrR family transcriptional regulator [Oceanospirillales bacterium]